MTSQLSKSTLSHPTRSRASLPALLVMLVVLLLLAGGSTGFFYLHNQRHTLKLQALQQANAKQIADLNDRLVAVARAQALLPQMSPDSAAALPRTSVNPLPSGMQQLQQLQKHWLVTALQIAQQQLNASNPAQAQSLILQLQHTLLASHRLLPAPLQSTLLHTLKTDQQAIGHYIKRQQQVRQRVDDNLAQLQQQLNALAVQGITPDPTGRDKPSPWWKRLVVIERRNEILAQHQLDRQFIYKQASLNIAMARLALADHNPQELARYLQDAMQQLGTLSDARSRHLLHSVQMLSHQPLGTPIQLASLTLLTGAAPAPLAQNTLLAPVP